MDPITWITLLTLVMALIKQGFLSAAEIMPVLEKYRAIPHTDENEKLLKGELLDMAKRSLPMSDPALLAQLTLDGVTAEELQ